MSKKLGCLTVFLVGILMSQSAYAESQALQDLKSQIARVQQMLVDRKFADPQKRDERRRVALAVLHRSLISTRCRAVRSALMRADTATACPNLRRSSSAY